MIRQTLTILSLVGLLLSVGLWGVSYPYHIMVYRHGEGVLKGHVQLLVSWKGGVYRTSPHFVDSISMDHLSVVCSKGVFRVTSQDQLASAKAWMKGFGVQWFGYKRGVRITWHRGGFNRYQQFSVPLAVPTVVFSFLFWRSFTPIHRRRKRKRLGLCLKCGYDLRGSREKCPECGTAIEKQ